MLTLTPNRSSTSRSKSNREAKRTERLLCVRAEGWAWGARVGARVAASSYSMGGMGVRVLALELGSQLGLLRVGIQWGVLVCRLRLGFL